MSGPSWVRHRVDYCYNICAFLRDSLVDDLEDIFTLPVYFSSDWLNEFWDVLNVDDYRFVYAGPKGTW